MIKTIEVYIPANKHVFRCVDDLIRIEVWSGITPHTRHFVPQIQDYVSQSFHDDYLLNRYITLQLNNVVFTMEKIS